MKKSLQIMGLAGMVCSLFVYGFSLFNPFYLDDFAVIRDNAWLKTGIAPGGWFTSFFVDSFQTFPGYRPLLMLSYWVNAYFLGVTPIGFRIVNLGLHLFNSFLLAKIVQNLDTHQKNRGLSWIVALLFALHPVQTLAINFLWKRSSVLETFFIFLSLLLHVTERVRQKTYRKRMMGFQVALLLGCLFSKESGILLPVFLIALDILFFKGPSETKRTKVFYIIQSIIVFIFIGFRFGYIDSWMSSHRHFIDIHAQLSGWRYSLFTFSLLPKYLWVCLVPDPRIIEDPPLVINPYMVILSFSLIMGSVVLWIKNTSPLFRFSLLLVWLPLLMTVGPISLFFAMDQIRLYLPIAGFSYILIVGLGHLVEVGKRNSKKLKPLFKLEMVCFLLILSYSWQTYSQNRRYADPVLIWEDVANEYPESDLAWGELGAALQDAKQFGSATLAFSHAAKLNSTRLGYLIRAFHNMYLGGKSLEEIKPILKQISPDKIPVNDVVNLANMLREIGENQKALKLYVNAISRNPKLGPANLQLAYLLELLGKKESSHKYYSNAADLMPENKMAQDGRARTLHIE